MTGADQLTMTISGKRRRFGPAAATWLLSWLLLASLSAAAVGAAGIAAAGDDSTATRDTAAGPAAQPAPQMPPAAPGQFFPEQPPPIAKRGFLNDFGRWWTESVMDFGATVNNARGKFDDLTKKSNDAVNNAAAATQNAMKNAAEATKDAATSIVKLPNMRVFEVRERCATAPNGAPDCRAAATTACRAKGFASGQPFGVQSSENCPPAVLLSGRTPVAGECPVDTVVLLAACQ